VKKKIESWLRIKKREWSLERKKEREPRERKGKIKMSFYAKESEVKRAFLVDQPMIFLVYKESYLNLDETNQSLHSLTISLLQKFKDVFPEEMPSGLPPIRGIECQTDFVPGAVISNRPAYRSNPEETKELQWQVEDLLSKGYMRDSMSSCALPVLLVPKKDGTWRTCVDCKLLVCNWAHSVGQNHFFVMMLFNRDSAIQSASRRFCTIYKSKNSVPCQSTYHTVRTSNCPKHHPSGQRELSVRTFLCVDKLRTAPTCVRLDVSAARLDDSQCSTSFRISFQNTIMGSSLQPSRRANP
jgi:hypothetical protein